ncbi:hypothetical protein QE152_g6640 [Popillia japonica]|uniref:Uncharacterized protein n=1 Tax=Popillia japonica TaxID=7064 RepID=A0AAW1ME37_POPJA
MSELAAYISSSSSSDEDEKLVHTICGIEILREVPKNEAFSESTVPLFNENEFQMHFRIPRNDMVELAAKSAKSRFYPKCSTGFEKIPAMKCL